MDCPTPKKRKFGDRAAAEMYQEKLQKSGQRATKTEIYLCRCKCFHLASVDVQRSRRRKDKERKESR